MALHVPCDRDIKSVEWNKWTKSTFDWVWFFFPESHVYFAYRCATGYAANGTSIGKHTAVLNVTFASQREKNNNKRERFCVVDSDYVFGIIKFSYTRSWHKTQTLHKQTARIKLGPFIQLYMPVIYIHSSSGNKQQWENWIHSHITDHSHLQLWAVRVPPVWSTWRPECCILLYKAPP